MPDAPQSPQPAPQPARSWQPLILGIFAGACLIVAVLGVAFRSSGVGLFQLLDALRQGRTFIQVDAPVVVHQIQQLQRLETVRYSMDKIIAGGHDSPWFPKFLVSDSLLLVVHGEVIAGVDLSKLQPSDVTVNARTVSVHLPKPEVLVSRLDNERTRVYSRDTGLFSSPDPNLETEIRQEAERQLQQAALQDGILAAADQNARASVSSILRGLGFETIQFQ